jgi:hypothetical protein
MDDREAERIATEWTAEEVGEAAAGCLIGVVIVALNIVVILAILAIFDVDWWWL